jgi:Bacterial PH domain/Short C-terminal domain
MAKKKDSFITDITDGEELNEIRKIANMLNPDETVLLVARQSRIKPGGSFSTPNTVYATDRRIILRDPSMLGLKEEVLDIPYNVILNAHLEKGILSSSVIFNAPGLFNSNMSNRIPGIKKITEGEHGENGVIDAIPKIKGDRLVEIIRNGIIQVRANPGLNVFGNRNTSISGLGAGRAGEGGKPSVVQELEKLGELKHKGIISEDEFIKMKEKILKSE